MNRVFTGIVHQMDCIDDASLVGDDEPVRDLSAWRVTIPRIMSKRDPDNLRKQFFVFCIDVRRIDVTEGSDI
jgi:hypothetical protein